VRNSSEQGRPVADAALDSSDDSYIDLATTTPSRATSCASNVGGWW
jgi:hypothetical protein